MRSERGTSSENRRHTLIQRVCNCGREATKKWVDEMVCQSCYDALEKWVDEAAIEIEVVLK